jgi:hypothetical protein
MPAVKSRSAQPKPRKAPSKPATAGTKATRKNPAVDAWFEERQLPLKALMLRVRRVILAADPRVTESVKWSTPTFSFNGDIASFIPQAKGFVSLLFHRGAEIPGRHPRLLGDSRLARTMRFATSQELSAHEEDLRRVIRAWCDYKAK